MHIVNCDHCSIPLYDGINDMIFSNVDAGYDLCGMCAVAQPGLVMSNSCQHIALLERTGGLPSSHPVVGPPPLAPDMMGPMFHPVYNPVQPFASASTGPFETAPTKKRKYYRCKDHKGHETIKAISPSDGDAFKDLMKTFSSVRNVPEEEMDEEAKQMTKVSVGTLQKKDKVRFVSPSEFAGSEGVLIGLDANDGIVKMCANSDIRICPLEHLVKLTAPPLPPVALLI